MRRFLAIILITAPLVGCSRTEHANVKVKALHPWEAGRAKHCMLLTGRSVTEGGKSAPDPREMWCNDQRKSDPDQVQWDYERISNVVLDKESERQFHNSQKWGVPVLCQEASASKLNCVFDGTE
jgi:hypothetical protein